MGSPREIPTSEKVLSGVASRMQQFKPLDNICAHLNAFHVYADEPSRYVETNHYCAHIDKDVRQCLLYDSAEVDARLIGIEYMISPELFKTLDQEEQRLWHSHVFEVKSGMLILPNPIVPEVVWKKAESEEMEGVISLYGKVFHLWQTDKHHKVPLGRPKLMTSFTSPDQIDYERVKQRDEHFGVKSEEKKIARENIPVPEVHENADWTWKALEEQK